MSSSEIRKRLQKVGVEVDLKDIELDNLKIENSSLKKQLEESQEKEKFLEHELEETGGSLAVERLAVRGLSGLRNADTVENGLDSNVMKILVGIYIFLHRHCRFNNWTILLLWIFFACLVGAGISAFLNIFF